MSNQIRQYLPRNSKRKILVVDDEAINREMLGKMLQENDFEVLYAENGVQALEVARANVQTLSLIMLDVLMPLLDGFGVLQALKEDENLRRIPVIVLTTEPSYELKSLKMGAMDFIKKPYDMPEIVYARVNRIIELSEKSYIIQSTEQDALTGMLNREFFFEYAGQNDRYHPDTQMDAITLNVMRFHVFNELYGHEAGDELLRRTGAWLRDFAEQTGGITCREDADNFLIYCPHQQTYNDFLPALERELGKTLPTQSLHFRMGVYPGVDKQEDLRRRFDFAKLASKASRDAMTDHIAVYDEALHQKHLLSRRLLEEMDTALTEHQFVVYYQPKFSIQGAKPVLASAEALVRWKHPKLGMISPGLFVPLFEESGLISKLDHYVWKEAAGQIRAWRERFGITVPVSVNVSRVDLFDPELVSNLLTLIRDNALNPDELLLEITESAYTESADQIIQTVNALRAVGFRIEMDDFGSGYSSLNMLAQMPIDVLKLDMLFVRGIESNAKDRHIIKLLLNIKNDLNVPAIAEGVETEGQFSLLREMGCDLIQGYYFSPPVPAEQFEQFLAERGA